MLCCTFFGHSDCPDEIEPVLRETIEKLITRKGVTMFYVGNSGNFDRIVLKVIKEFQNYLYDIDYLVVLSYFPTTNKDIYEERTILPDDFEEVSPRYAIDFRNNYMLNQADYVITYTTRDFGGAAKFEKKARSRKKQVINIADLINKT